MSWRYEFTKHIVGLPSVDGGQCVRLVQHYIPEIGHTSTWEKGELVIASKVLMRGMAIANFNEAGRWPGKDHNNHACLIWDWGARDMESGLCDWVEVAEQFVGTNIQVRRLHRQGRSKSYNWNSMPNNADAFWIIEQKGQPHVTHTSRSGPPGNHYMGDACPDRNEGEAMSDDNVIRSDRWPTRWLGR
jgi:hypothetical protein